MRSSVLHLLDTAFVNYDDMDSIAEYVVEKISGDDSLTTEEDDDAGSAQDKDLIQGWMR